MASHNPNTKYGRRKNREELHRKYSNMSGREKSDFDSTVWILRFVLFIIAMAVCLIVIMCGGTIK